MNKERGDILFTLLIYLAIAAAVLGAIYGVYRAIDRSWETTAGIERGAKDKQAAWDAAVAAQRESERLAAETASTKLGKANEKAKVVYRTITRDVDKIVERVSYRNLCLDDSGMRAAAAAIVGTEGKPAAELGRSVPGAPGTSRRDGSGSAPLDRGGG